MSSSLYRTRGSECQKHAVEATEEAIRAQWEALAVEWWLLAHCREKQDAGDAWKAPSQSRSLPSCGVERPNVSEDLKRADAE